MMAATATARARSAGRRWAWLAASTVGSITASGVPFREPVGLPGRVPAGEPVSVAADIALLVDLAREPRAVLLPALGVAVFLVSAGHESFSSRQQPSGQFRASAGTPEHGRSASGRVFPCSSRLAFVLVTTCSRSGTVLTV